MERVTGLILCCLLFLWPAVVREGLAYFHFVFVYFIIKVLLVPASFFPYNEPCNTHVYFILHFTTLQNNLVRKTDLITDRSSPEQSLSLSLAQ